MRWELTKRAWALARDKFPEVERLYVSIPEHLARHGECMIVDLSSPAAELGKVAYEVRPHGRYPVMRISLMDSHDQVQMPTCSVEANIVTKACKASVSAIDPRLLASKCNDAFELGRRMALLATSGTSSKITRKEASSWMSKWGFPPDMITPFVEGLVSLGAFEEDGSVAYNMKWANKKGFDANQRVRVNSPGSMEHQECGRVIDSRGKGNEPTWYLVHVDGSEKPAWFPEVALGTDDAGKVIDPDLGTDE
jgi:hypothetical protein